MDARVCPTAVTAPQAMMTANDRIRRILNWISSVEGNGNSLLLSCGPDSAGQYGSPPSVALTHDQKPGGAQPIGDTFQLRATLIHHHVAAPNVAGTLREKLKNC